MMNLSDYLNQPNTDISVSATTFIDEKYCFVLQPPTRWGHNESGNDILFFGGIGGKVEKGESLIDALAREVKEEINGQIKLISNTSQHIAIMTPKSVTFKQFNDNSLLSKPLFIYQNERSEAHRQKITNVFSYGIEITNPDHIQPHDNPAIILIPPEILPETEYGLPVSDAILKGVKFIANIPLPTNGILKPTPTPLALIQLAKQGISIRHYFL